MIWDFPINEYFVLNEEERLKMLNTLTKYYFDKHISLENEEYFIETTDRLINAFIIQQNEATKKEEFEKAEICYQLARNFIQIQDNWENL